MDTLNNVAFECILVYCTLKETQALALVNRKISSIVRQYRYRTYYWNIYHCNYDFVHTIVYIMIHGDYGFQLCTMLDLLPPNIRGVWFQRSQSSEPSGTRHFFHPLIEKYSTDRLRACALLRGSNIRHLILNPFADEYCLLNIPKDCKLEVIDLLIIKFKGHITIEVGNTNLKWIRIPFYMEDLNWLTRNGSRVKVIYKK